jgi:hypothetical protein
MSTLKWSLSYIILMGAVALAAGLWRAYGSSEACEMDGQAISPSLRVDLTMADGNSHAFCTIACAQRWLAGRANTAVKEALVRDAISGEPIDAYVAFFVRSELVTNRANGNAVHAFRFRADAMEHVRQFGGQLIEDPFEAP